jgi:3-hydroxybutyryl-CoA dehydrogenase
MSSTTIERVGVVGAGFMGTGIAEAVARAGLDVRLYEPDEAPLERSRERLSSSLTRALEAGKLQPPEGDALRERVEWTTDFEGLAGCDLVIEAVVEDARVKGEVFQRLSGLLGPGALIASNTSSIPIAELASWSEHRERVLGLHFFSPAQVMRLVEVVVGIDTAPEAVERAEAFVERIGKRPIQTKDRSGFIVNMLLVPYLMAGVRMYEEGFATREAIDEGMRLGCGHPMGPLELADFIGLDVLYAVCDSLYEEFKQPEYAPPPLLKRLVVSGHHGRKTGRGFYEYG